MRPPLTIYSFHQAHGATFLEVNGTQAVADYGDFLAEHDALRRTAGILDLSFRSRLCLTGADRIRFLHGQVTNDIKTLRPGQGIYAALVNAKGRMESDLNIYCLADELLLDFEPGLTATVAQRLEKYIVADDVQVVEVDPLYGQLSVQGPAAAALLRGIGGADFPSAPNAITKLTDTTLGELYVANQPRLGSAGFDLFAPGGSLQELAARLLQSAAGLGARLCGWRALETVRVEAGIPRFGIDMDESNFPQECRIDSRAMSYTKGCYLGQEVLNRIHTMGHVNRQLCGLRFSAPAAPPPAKGSKLLHEGKEVGTITSAVHSPALQATIALGFVRREANRVGDSLTAATPAGEHQVRIVDLPFA